jgi:hypothetical protein
VQYIALQRRAGQRMAGEVKVNRTEKDRAGTVVRH